jgi:hypothetical protein
MAKFKLVRGFLQKLGVTKLSDTPLPPGTVFIGGQDVSKHVRDVEITYTEPQEDYPSASELISYALHTGALDEILLEEQRKWEIGQEDTQPLPVITDGPPLVYGKDYYLGDRYPAEEDYGDDPITPGGTWPEEMDCE